MSRRIFLLASFPGSHAPEREIEVVPLAPPTGNKEKYGWLARLSLIVDYRVLSDDQSTFALVLFMDKSLL